MSGECDKCGQHTLECLCIYKDLGFIPKISDIETAGSLLVQSIREICDEETQEKIKKRFFELINDFNYDQQN